MSSSGVQRFLPSKNISDILKTNTASLGSFANPAKNATELYSAGFLESGYYWISPPNSSNSYYVYCDQVNYQGGWMLLMNVATGGSIHVLQNTATYGNVDGNATVVFDAATDYRLSTTTINEFLNQSGTKVTWIEPKRTSSSVTLGAPYQWFQRPGTQTSPLWPSNLETSNYSTIIGNTQTSWVYTGYSSALNALNNSGGLTGTYSSTNHYAPTIYPEGQTFFSGSGANGIRFATAWNSVSGNTDGNAGYLWLKIYS